MTPKALREKYLDFWMAVRTNVLVALTGQVTICQANKISRKLADTVTWLHHKERQKKWKK